MYYAAQYYYSLKNGYNGKNYMQPDIIAIGIAYTFGIAAHFFGLPPLVGFLLAGFILYAGDLNIPL